MASIDDMLDRQQRHLALVQGRARRFTRRAVVRALARFMVELDRIPGDDYGGWTRASEQAVRVQLEAALLDMRDASVEALVRVHGTAAERSYLNTKKWLVNLDKRFTGSVRPLSFNLASFMAEESNFLINRYERSLAFWGRSTSRAMRELLADQMLVGASWADAAAYLRKHIPAAAAKKQWMVERVARTEMANAYNGVALAQLQAEDRPEDPMMKKLVATWDKKTAADSKRLHGQTVPVNRPFIDVTGREYMHPPNRPNDREVIVGWKKSYGAFLGDFKPAGAA